MVDVDSKELQPAYGTRSRWREAGWQRRQTPIVLAWAVVVITFAVVSMLEPGFRSGANVRSLIDQSAVLGLVALGQTVVIICRGIDLSVPAMMAVAGVVVTRADPSPESVAVALGIVALVAVALGLVNGLAVAVLDAPAIVVTLATNTLLLGALLVATDGARTQTGGAPPAFLRELAVGRVGPLPVSGIVWLTVAVVAAVLLSRSVFGRGIYAVGNNPTAARLAGVSVIQTTVAAYVLSAFASACGGLLLAGYLNQTFPTMGSEYLFTSIAAVMIGGASILGGTGNYAGTVAGALALSVLGGVLALLNLAPAYLRILYGLMILGTVAVGAWAGSRRPG